VHSVLANAHRLKDGKISEAFKVFQVLTGNVLGNLRDTPQEAELPAIDPSVHGIARVPICPVRAKRRLLDFRLLLRNDQQSVALAELLAVRGVHEDLRLAFDLAQALDTDQD
jgi:hypothetical protein